MTAEERDDAADLWWDYEEDESDEPCRCDGNGIYVVCVDDICRGLGYCIHGDGEEICPAHPWM